MGTADVFSGATGFTLDSCKQKCSDDLACNSFVIGRSCRGGKATGEGYCETWSKTSDCVCNAAYSTQECGCTTAYLCTDTYFKGADLKEQGSSSGDGSHTNIGSGGGGRSCDDVRLTATTAAQVPYDGPATVETSKSWYEPIDDGCCKQRDSLCGGSGIYQCSAGCAALILPLWESCSAEVLAGPFAKFLQAAAELCASMPPPPPPPGKSRIT
jgi:hypothetical protein